MKSLKLFFLFIVVSLISQFKAHAGVDINIGILAYLPKEQMEQRYQPLVDYLNSKLDGRKVRLIPLSYAGDEVEKAIFDKRIDLLFTNPSHFIKLRTLNKLSGAILTQVVMRNNIPLNSFGGVIFTNTNNKHINKLEDIANSKIAAADPRSLGGYQAQAYEALINDVNIGQSIRFLKKHDKVVQAVLSGEADVGFVRSGVIESLKLKSEIDLSNLKIINQISHPDFPFILSTRLYPEWPVIALPQLASQDVRRIASALLSLDKNLPAAKAAKIGGFDPPADYLPVEELARALRVPPYDKSPEFTLDDIWLKHKVGVIALIITFFIISILSLIILRKNRSLATSRESLRQAASVFTHTHEGITITNADGLIIDVNKAFERITGFSKEDVIGKNPSILKSGIQDSEFYKSMWEQLKQTHKWQGEIWNRRKNGEVYAELLVINAVVNSHNMIEGYVGLFSDITPQKEQQKQLEFLAHYDALTGLPNRIVFSDRLKQAIKQAHRHGKKIALAYIDLDGFKEVNDNFGHSVGDKVLIEMAKRMQDVLREGDTIARIGGDEFIGLILDITSEEDENDILKRILNVITEPLQIDDRQHRLSASIGVTTYPQQGDINSELLIKQADQAMYVAKTSGKNRCHIYEHDE